MKWYECLLIIACIVLYDVIGDDVSSHYTGGAVSGVVVAYLYIKLNKLVVKDD